MKLKTLTWNIGGAKLLKENTDPTLSASYVEDGLESIIDLIKSESPDIIAIQESHQGQGYDQIEQIAKALGYDYYLHDSTSSSHIDTNYQLGHGIISKYPILKSRFGLFNNPKLEVVLEDGSVATSFDKGFSSCAIEVDETIVEVATLHLISFRRFDIDMESSRAQEILQDVVDKLTFDAQRALVMGDFNIDNPKIEPYLGSLFSKDYFEEVSIEEPTTPKGRSYDHVLYRGLTFESKHVIADVKTDHYPVLCIFEVD